jgi:hypothetical protein
MSALGFMTFGFGMLMLWSGLERQNVFNVLRAILGGTTVQTDAYGQPTGNKPPSSNPTRLA